MPPLPFEVISSSLYLESLDQRLNNDAIIERTIYTMMARTKKMGRHAFMATASIIDMRSKYGYTLADVELKDTKDFRTYFTIESAVHDGLLIPTKLQKIIIKNGTSNTALTEAYLLGYNDGMDDESIKDASDLSECSTEDFDMLLEYSKILADSNS